MATTLAQAVARIQINGAMFHGRSYYNLAKKLPAGEAQDRLFKAAWSHFYKAATLGFVPSIYNIGVMYKRGEGVARDIQKGFLHIKKAAEQGFYPAQFGLGMCYERGEGVSANSIEALKWYKFAGEQGCVEAQIAYEKLMKRRQEGVVLQATSTSGTNNSKPSSTSMSSSSVSSSSNKVRGAALLRQAQSIFIEIKNNVKMSPNEKKIQLAQADSLLEAAAKEGVPEAQYVFGTFLLEGRRGVVQNTKRAIEYFEAAKNGDIYAEYVLGACTEEALKQALATIPKKVQETELAHAKRIHEEVKKALQAETPIQGATAPSSVGGLLLSCTSSTANSSSLSSTASTATTSTSASSFKEALPVQHEQNTDFAEDLYASGVYYRDEVNDIETAKKYFKIAADGGHTPSKEAYDILSSSYSLLEQEVATSTASAASSIATSSTSLDLSYTPTLPTFMSELISSSENNENDDEYAEDILPAFNAHKRLRETAPEEANDLNTAVDITDLQPNERTDGMNKKLRPTSTE